jgi:hypothetical protein
MYKIFNSFKEISHDQLLFPSFYFKTTELPVSANYGRHLTDFLRGIEDSVHCVRTTTGMSNIKVLIYT